MAASSPANPKNEFDYVGDIHNQIVSEYVKKYGRDKRTTDEICKLIQEIALKNEQLQKLPDAEENTRVDCGLVKKGIEDFSNQFENIVESIDISTKAKTNWKKEIDETTPTETSLKRTWWQWAIVGAADIAGVAGGGIGTGASASSAAYTMTNPNNK